MQVSDRTGTARRKSKVKSQKYYGMGFLGILNGCSYLRRGVLVYPRFAQAWLALGFKRIMIFSGSVKFLNP